MAASAMTETILPREMLANMSVSSLLLNFPPTLNSANSPNLLLHLLRLSAILKDLTPVARCLRSVQVMLQKSDGNEAKGLSSRLILRSHLQQCVVSTVVNMCATSKD